MSNPAVLHLSQTFLWNYESSRVMFAVKSFPEQCSFLSKPPSSEEDRIFLYSVSTHILPTGPTFF